MALFDIIQKLQPNLNQPNLEEIGDFGYQAGTFGDVTASIGNKVSSSVNDFKTKLSSSLSDADTDSDGSLSAKEIIKVAIPIITPILISIATSEENINKATKEATTLLNRKGRVEIQGTTVNFYPIADGPWLEIKAQFDKRIQSITNSINRINNLITKLNKYLGTANKILTGLEIYLTFRINQLNAKLAAAFAELTSPSPTKPVTAQTLLTINDQIIKNEKLQKNIDDVNDAIGVLNALLSTATSLLNNLKSLLSQAQLNIITNPADYQLTKEELLSSFNTTEVPLTLEETITGSNGIRYTIKIVELKDGFNKAVAYDSLSNSLVTQTAPSIIKTPYELIQELKQILS